jgi:hypothetical protein
MKERRTVHSSTNVEIMKNDLGIEKERFKNINLEISEKISTTRKRNSTQSVMDVDQRKHVQGKKGSALTERLSVQGLTMQFAADTIRILDAKIRDCASEEDKAKYDGASSRLLRSSQSVFQSTVGEITMEQQKNVLKASSTTHELATQEVNEELQQRSWFTRQSVQ